MRKRLFSMLFSGILLASLPAQAAPSGDNEPVGEIFGQKVTRQAFESAYKTNTLFSVSTKNLTTEKERRLATWQFLVLIKEAAERGITVTRPDVEKELARLVSEKNVVYGSYNYMLWVKDNFKEKPKAFERRVEDSMIVGKLLEQVFGGPDKPSEAAAEKGQAVLNGLFEKAQIKDYRHDKVLSVETSEGTFEVQLYPDLAPKASENFERLAAKGYYDGLTFHRVIAGFMIQGGDPSGNGTGGKSIWGETFEDEVTPAVGFDRPGLLAMANSGPDTNGSQFFVTVAPKPGLNMRHTIFGEVISGYDVVKKISQTPTTGEPEDRPLKEQKIIRVTAKKWL